MQINAPFAYTAVEPVLKSHRIVREVAAVPTALRETNAIPISFAELPLAARDYPVVFIRPREDGPLRIVALIGLQAEQNLFVDEAGQWAAGVYRPAYLRRYPFCMATVRREGQSAGERIICVESAHIDAERGEPVADEAGQPLPWWEQTSRFITDFEADLLRTEKVCDVIDKNNILEPFAAQASGEDADAFSISGMYRVNETKLARLTADTLRMLISKGIMGRLYAHLMSLDRFGQLMERARSRG